MAEDPTLPHGWLPPQAPGANPPPRFESPSPAASGSNEESPAPAARRTGYGAGASWAPPRGAAPTRAPESSWAAPAQRPAGPQPPSRTAAVAPGARPAAGRVAPGNTLAVVGVVLGVLGLTLLVLSLGLSVVISMPCAAAAWVCGAQARRRVRDGHTQAGAGLARTAYWLGVAGAILCLVSVIVWAVLLINGYSIEELQNSLERELEQQRARDA